MYVYLVYSYEDFDTVWSTPEQALARQTELRKTEGYSWWCSVYEIDSLMGHIFDFDTVEEAVEGIAQWEIGKKYNARSGT